MIKRTFLSLIAILIIAGSCKRTETVEYVDPNIGTIAQLLTTKVPTVHRPNSMIRVFPVTKPGLNDRYLSDRIYGFAINMPSYRGGQLTELMPTTGKINVIRDEYASLYDHANEEVHPWHHRVELEDYGIIADWTTTEKAVIYRFSYGHNDSCNIIFRASRNSEFTTEGNNIIKGWEEVRDMKQYFHAELSIPFEGAVSFSGNEISATTTSSGRNSGIVISLNPKNKPVEVRIGISYIDENQAAANLHNETNSKTFETVMSDSRNIWADALGRIEVIGGTEREKRIFYTSLYRSLERMVNISEDGKYYSGYDKRVHTDDLRPFYVDDWLWDTYRSLHPLMLIIDPAKQADMVESYIRMYEQSGWMPSFPQVHGDSPPMIGLHSAALVWDTWQKGVKNISIEKAYEGLRKTALQGTAVAWRMGAGGALDSIYRELGWFPALPEGVPETDPMVDGFEKRQAVSVTLEHSYDDWCIAQLAKDLGHEADYELFMKTSENYRNLFNPENKFFAPKTADGKWIEPFDPQLSGSVGGRLFYTENNAWTWNFSVQHNIPGLINMIGGNDAFVKRLDRLFNEPTTVSKWQFMGQFPDATGLNGMFVAGNEPSFHIPYLYNYAGQPWKTQRRIRELMNIWFDDKPMGIPGDEDGGGLCSWYVFSAMGFYPVTPGSGEYAIGSPFFETVKIKLPDGKTFKIIAKGSSAKNKYIQSAKLNGNELNRPFITHSDIMNGGNLQLIMGDKPNKSWGKL
ncbi:MAG: GH92 family glycosyl hydrolase [Bacteroidales bacterium]|nr:GH92 family glycosyl hydrolase [Bacteroidales bacterium]